MNNSGIKSLAVIIFLATLFTGCPEIPDEPQKQITVTDIPSSYGSYRYGTVILCRHNYIYDDLDFVAISDSVLITNGKTTMKMYDAYKYYLEPYTGSGEHGIIFFISDSGDNILYNGLITSTDISKENTSVKFNYFIQLPLTPVLPSVPNKLNFDELMPLIIEKLKKE